MYQGFCSALLLNVLEQRSSDIWRKPEPCIAENKKRKEYKGDGDNAWIDVQKTKLMC